MNKPLTDERQLTETEWKCPHCGTVNHDIFALTAIPACQNDGVRDGVHHGVTFWEDILTSEQYAVLNNELRRWREPV